MIHFDVKGTITGIGIVLCLLLISLARPRRSLAEFAVVATTSIIADTAKQIGEDDVHVDSLMGPGVDPHLYKASPGDLRKLSQASLIFHNGLHLEGRISDILEKIARRQPVVAVTDTIPRNLLRHVSTSPEVFDPHVWLDVSLWTRAAQAMRDAMIAHDPTHETGYRARFEEFATRLSLLDKYCQKRSPKFHPDGAS